MKRKIIIDSDPGHDDALAILLAAKHLDVLGITTVHGNQIVEKTTRNALWILEMAGLSHIPVAKGCALPMISPLTPHPAGHGESGLDGPQMWEPVKKADPRHAVDFLIETIHANPGVTLVPIGPLTNVGMALRRDPSIVKDIAEISLMGGAPFVGNTAPVSELNVESDPEAAQIVFRSGVPLKMCGLNLTRTATATPARTERFRSIGNHVGQVVYEIVTWYSAAVKKAYGLEGASLHDACAVAWLIDPSLIESVHAHVDVELEGQYTRGMTVCDLRYFGAPGTVVQGGGGMVAGQPPNTHIAMKLDVERFFDLLVNTFALYP
jgi:inosine-uridine nucleoside N-ribohydrolase